MGGYEWALITFLYYVVIFFTLTKFYLIKMEAQNPATEMPSIPWPWFSSLRAVAVLVAYVILLEKIAQADVYFTIGGH